MNQVQVIRARMTRFPQESRRVRVHMKKRSAEPKLIRVRVKEVTQ
jgi:hypothetical protein